MSTDSGEPLPDRPARDPRLPGLRDLRYGRVAFEPPALDHFQSSLAGIPEVVEFIVETDGPVPARAYGPALFVGDIEVDQSERIGETTWRLLAFEPDALRPGAPITWGWMRDPETSRQPTEYRYEGT